MNDVEKEEFKKLEEVIFEVIADKECLIICAVLSKVISIVAAQHNKLCLSMGKKQKVDIERLFDTIRTHIKGVEIDIGVNMQDINVSPNIVYN